jgi:myxalamid-type polyketide synthase MxaB
LIAGVNSFGFGGTNAHVVMGGVEVREDRELGDWGNREVGDWGDRELGDWGNREVGDREDRELGDWGDALKDSLRIGEIGRANLLTLSAKSKAALAELAQSYLDFLPNCNLPLAEICSATQRQRSHFNHRLTCIVNFPEQLQQQLAAAVAQEEIAGLRVSTVSNQTKQICWLFTGQGSQYVGMGEELYHTQPVFKESLDHCAAILESYLERPLLEVIFSFSGTSTDADRQPEINRTIYTQPAIFAVEYALAQLWLAWGIKPDYVAGHSIGEYVAACIAGVFSLEDGLKLVATRGRLMEELPSSGGMLAIFSSQAKIAEAIAAFDQEVNIAAINHQQNTVIAGNLNTLILIEDKLANLDISSTLLEVSHAFHSPLMKPMLGDFRQVAKSVTYHLPQIPLVSNVTGKLAGEAITSPDYWVEHIIQPVNFAAGFQFLLEQKIDIFLEIGAKPILASIGATISSTNIPSNKDYAPILLPSLSNKQPDEQVILSSLAQLYHQGIKINWRNFSQKIQNSQGVKLPTYPFQRQRYWWEQAKFWTKDTPQQQLHPLLGNPLTLAGTTEIRWMGKINGHTPEYLADHCLESKTVFPATAYLEMALAAGEYIYSASSLNNSLQLKEFIIHQPLILGNKSTQLQTVLSPVADSAYQVQIFSHELDSDAFMLHSEVVISLQSEELTNNLDLAQLKSKLQLQKTEIADYYKSLNQQGLNYGASFQGIKQIWQGEKEALGYVQLPDNLSNQAGDYQIHPALLDACLQLIGTVSEADSGVYLPVGIESLSLAQAKSDRVWAYITIKPNPNQQIITADLVLADDMGVVVAEINNLSLQYVSWRSLQKFLNISTEAQNSFTEHLYEIEWEHKSLISTETIKTVDNDCWLIFSRDNELAQVLTQELAGIAVILGDRFEQSHPHLYTINPSQTEDWQSLWQAIDRQSKDNLSKSSNNLKIAYFCSQEDPISDPVSVRLYAEIFYLMQSISKPELNLTQLTIITEKTQIKAINNLAGGAWGLGRTITQEYPYLKCNLLDFDSLKLENLPQLLAELLAPEVEPQVAYHNQQRYVPRLTPKDHTLDHPYRLQLSAYGTLDNLSLAPMDRKSPQQGEIEIAVAASGVNFRDVLNALGVLKEYLQAMGFADSTEVPFGGECAGVVVAVGKGVTDFQIGDEVIAAQAVGSLSSHVIVKAKFAIAKPQNLTYSSAATIPTTFLTAYYGLHHLAKIKPGDRILIHAAAGGVGQAAVQIAQQIGAEVYATASSGKWDFLKASGIKYVMNSRNLDFAEEVMQLTEGKGVDLILNSLNGDFIPQNLAILAPNGRFIEIGKVGIWDRAQVAEVRDDISYFPFDLLEVSRQDPDLIASMFAELRRQFVEGKLKPLPHQVFPIQQADDAFRYMAQAKHIGKVIIDFPANDRVVKTDGSYLITGGMGALGLQVANWLAESGAKHLMLLGRNQPGISAQQAIDRLKQQGVKVEPIQIDISDRQAVNDLFESFNSSQVNLKGIIHAAGILDDGLLNSLCWERFQRVLQPKIAGTWNLHQATKELPLDWFVCFSSIASAFGAAGQSNYATANAFMDSLMSDRRNQGLPGLSINWSIWSEVGMASRLTPEQQQRLSQQGLTAIAPAQGLKILQQLLQQQATQTIVFPVDWETFLRQQPDNPFFERVKPQTKVKTKTATSSFLQQLAQTNPEQQHHLLQSHIREQIAKVLGFADPKDVDTEEKFADLGMDSLMAVEFKNNLQASFGNVISLSAAFDYPNVELLTAYLAQELANTQVLATINQPSPQLVKAQIPPVKPESNIPTKSVTKESITPFIRSKIEIKPEYSQFKLTPEYLNLKKDLQRVEQLGNPFFSLHQGIAQDTIQTGDRQLINYSSYNYLGMSGDPTVIAATQKAIAEYGTSVSASRVLSGERPIHLELEQEIADLIGTEAAIVYVGGHATNVSTIGHLFGNQDLIICDALCHNSIREGCNLSGAKIIDFPHNDCQALEEILNRERTKYQKVLIAIEGIYSTDGDLAPLPEIVALKQHYQTFLLVDEAHSIGVLGLSGGGIREHYHLQPTDVDLWMGTLSKSFASCGGYIAGSSELIEYLKYTAPGFVFSVGMSPANTAAALAAIRLLKAEPERAIKLQSRAKFCLDLAKSKGFNTGYSADSPVIPIIVGEPHKAVHLSQLLNQAGINVNPMVYPSVPYDAARLRFFITHLHTEAQIQQTMEVLSSTLYALT